MKRLSFTTCALLSTLASPPDLDAWGTGHYSMTEAAWEPQSDELQEHFSAMHHNEHEDRDDTLAWYLTHRFCMHPDWVDGPSRNGEDVAERMRSTKFVYAQREGKYFPPIAYTDPNREEKGPRPKTFHYFSLRTEEANRLLARKGSKWYFEKIAAAFREGRDVDAAEYLGAFAHAIEDRVSPYHVWDGCRDEREAVETRYEDEGLQSPDGSRKERPAAASLFWGLGGGGMDNGLSDDFHPRSLGDTPEKAARAFVERLFAARAEAEEIYTDSEGFMAAHLADDWKNRGASERTTAAMELAAEPAVRLAADVIHTAWKLSR